MSSYSSLFLDEVKQLYRQPTPSQLILYYNKALKNDERLTQVELDILLKITKQKLLKFCLEASSNAQQVINHANVLTLLQQPRRDWPHRCWARLFGTTSSEIRRLIIEGNRYAANELWNREEMILQSLLTANKP